MKREREKRYYFIYGNLTERFKDSFYHSKVRDLEWLLENPENSFNFQTCYSLENGEYSLKDKHYIQIFHMVILDFFGEIPEEIYDLNINTITNTDNQIYLYFTIKAKQKDEAIFVGAAVAESGTESLDVSGGPEQGI